MFLILYRAGDECPEDAVAEAGGVSGEPTVVVYGLRNWYCIY